MRSYISTLNASRSSSEVAGTRAPDKSALFESVKLMLWVLKQDARVWWRNLGKIADGTDAPLALSAVAPAKS
jgi:hypothetical protein